MWGAWRQTQPLVLSVSSRLCSRRVKGDDATKSRRLAPGESIIFPDPPPLCVLAAGSAGLWLVYDGRVELGGLGAPVDQARAALHQGARHVQDPVLQRRPGGHESQAHGPRQPLRGALFQGKEDVTKARGTKRLGNFTSARGLCA